VPKPRRVSLRARALNARSTLHALLRDARAAEGRAVRELLGDPGKVNELHVILADVAKTAAEITVVAGAPRTVVVRIRATEHCSQCDADFTDAEQRAFDPDDNDHCPRCGARGTLTTLYGSGENRMHEHELDEFSRL